jgi:hypothetical protein
MTNAAIISFTNGVHDDLQEALFLISVFGKAVPLSKLCQERSRLWTPFLNLTNGKVCQSNTLLLFPPLSLSLLFTSTRRSKALLPQDGDVDHVPGHPPAKLVEVKRRDKERGGKRRSVFDWQTLPLVRLRKGVQRRDLSWQSFESGTAFPKTEIKKRAS